MNAPKRPFPVLLLCFLYIAAGATAFAANFSSLPAGGLAAAGTELVEVLAVVAGVFMFLGHNWARWLALAWIAFHVAISIPVPRLAAIHLLFFAVIAWILFRPAARRYFSDPRLGRRGAAS